MFMTIAEKYLQKEIKQASLFEDIKTDIKNILAQYNFEKLVFVEHGDTPGEIFVEVQEEFPSQLITDLDEYMGFQGTIKKTEYRIRFKYQLPEEVKCDGKICRKTRPHIR